MVHVVETAKKMGVYTIVTDMDPHSPAKRYADKAYDISTGEIDAVVRMAKAERVDGVFVGYDDQNTEFAVNICQQLELTFYATKDQIDITKNKIAFKNLCRNFGVPVVPEYSSDQVQFPCVVKPADSYSAKGITICFQEEELQNAIDFAKQYSKAGQYLIEKYMDYSVADCVNIDYLLIDGEIILTLVGDKRVVKQGNKAPLTDAVEYPSKHVLDYIQNVDSRVKEMFASLGMKNGTVFIESFYDKDGFAIYEMGYRVGGGQSSIILNYTTGFDYVEMLINYTLTGKMSDKADIRFDPVNCRNSCGMVLLVKPGTVSKIQGLDLIAELPGVINITQYLYEGDSVDNRFLGTLGQTFARIHIVADTKRELDEKEQYIRETLHVYDQNMQDMVVSNRR